MAQGLQAWDGSGRLVTDLGDFNMRWVQDYTVACTGTGLTWDFGYGPMTNTGWLVLPPWDANSNVSNYVCVANNGSFTVRYLWTTHSSVGDTFTVGIYTYS